jgi:hypothetical protein
MSAAAQTVSTANRTRPADPLDLLYERCCELAEQVSEGWLPFIDAVDMGYDAAVWSGLIFRVGDDAVQEVLAAAFIGIHR